MISRANLRVYRLLINLSYTTFLIPFRWNEQRENIGEANCGSSFLRRRFIDALVFFNAFGLSCFCGIVMFNMVMRQELETSDRVVGVCYISACTVFIVIFLSNLLLKEDIRCLVNSLIQFNLRMSKQPYKTNMSKHIPCL
jgi:hypothetical protein